MTTETTKQPTQVTMTFDSLGPATGAVLAACPVHGDEEVRVAVDGGRTTATWWSSLTAAQHKHRLLVWRNVIAARYGRRPLVGHIEIKIGW